MTKQKKTETQNNVIYAKKSRLWSSAIESLLYTILLLTWGITISNIDINKTGKINKAHNIIPDEKSNPPTTWRYINKDIFFNLPPTTRHTPYSVRDILATKNTTLTIVFLICGIVMLKKTSIIGIPKINALS